MDYKNIEEREFKEILLQILIELDNFCKTKNIKYFLIAGSLIGAVRHNGFIPWDDDIDVCMLREDYEKFIKEYKPTSKMFKLLSLETDKKYNYSYAKLIDDRTILVEENNKDISIGVFVDIFPLDNCKGNNFNEACKTLDKMNFLHWLKNFKILSFDRRRSFFKNFVLFIGKIMTLCLSRRQIAKKINKRAKKYFNLKTKYVGEIMNTAYGYGEIFPKELFDEVIDVKFENRYFSAPKRYDEILKSMYGDYMKLPPKDKQISKHHFKCFYKEDIDI